MRLSVLELGLSIGADQARHSALYLVKLRKMETLMKSSFLTVAAILAGLSVPAMADNNTTKIDQVGSDSSADVTQTGDATTNFAHVKQAGGTDNHATID